MTMANKTFNEILLETGLPVAYGFFDNDQEPPFLVYLGDGQEQFSADNQLYTKANTYQVEFYFTDKNEPAEEAIEDTLEANGYFYMKSADNYINEQNIFVIYYNVWRKGYING